MGSFQPRHASVPSVMRQPAPQISTNAPPVFPTPLQTKLPEPPLVPSEPSSTSVQQLKPLVAQNPIAAQSQVCQTSSAKTKPREQVSSCQKENRSVSATVSKMQAECERESGSSLIGSYTQANPVFQDHPIATIPKNQPFTRERQFSCPNESSVDSAHVSKRHQSTSEGTWCDRPPTPPERPFEFKHLQPKFPPKAPEAPLKPVGRNPCAAPSSSQKSTPAPAEPKKASASHKNVIMKSMKKDAGALSATTSGGTLSVSDLMNFDKS